MSANKIDSFVQSKVKWIERKRSEFQKYSQYHQPLRYLDGDLIYYLDQPYALTVQAGHDLVSLESESEVSATAGLLVVETSKSLTDAEHNQVLVEKWLNQRAKQVFSVIYQRATEKFDYPVPPPMKIRNMKTRWGSYSKKTHTIYLSLRLIHASVEAIEYVCIHELTHVQFQNHGPDFRALMQSKLPRNWRTIKRELELKYGGTDV
jgi:predicted metal-dependent hydrolase